MEPKNNQSGREDRIKLEGDWGEAVGRALAKKRPARGWPKPKAKKTAKKREK